MKGLGHFPMSENPKKLSAVPAAGAGEDRADGAGDRRVVRPALEDILAYAKTANEQGAMNEVLFALVVFSA